MNWRRKNLEAKLFLRREWEMVGFIEHENIQEDRI